MENVKNLNDAIKLIVAAHTIKGTSFVGLREYVNKQGEKSNQTIIAGITYENCLLNDFNALQEYGIAKFLTNEKLTKKFNPELIRKAFFEVYESLEKRLSSPEIKEELRKQNDATIGRSDAQIDAYIHITKGIKLHKETELLHVFGLVVKKTILQPIEYKKVASRDLTLCKNEIQKICEFKGLKYRNFIFNKSEVKIQGFTI